MKKVILAVSLFLVYSISTFGQSEVRTGTSVEWEYPKIIQDTIFLGEIEIIEPKPGQVYDSVAVFYWNRNEIVTDYAVTFYDGFGLDSDTIVTYTTKDTFLILPNTLKEGGVYAFSLQGFVYNDNNELISKNLIYNIHAFSIYLDPPELISPSDGAVGVQRDQKLIVNHLFGSGKHFYFMISRDSSFDKSKAPVFSNPIGLSNDGGRIWTGEEGIQENTTYYWKSSILLGNMPPALYSKSSPTWSFTTGIWSSVKNTDFNEIGYTLNNGTIYLENIHPEVSLQLHDLSGRVLLSRTGNTLDVSGVTIGTYFIVIDGKKVVKVQL
ncbi:MAG: hypothetical protein Kapaf2KO_18510 [Candidatus Kapaibacteriales bacterium]